MKNLIRNIVVLAAVVMVLGLTLVSCHRQTCPTYMQLPQQEQNNRV